MAIFFHKQGVLLSCCGQLKTGFHAVSQKKALRADSTFYAALATRPSPSLTAVVQRLHIFSLKHLLASALREITTKKLMMMMMMMSGVSECSPSVRAAGHADYTPCATPPNTVTVQLYCTIIHCTIMYSTQPHTAHTDCTHSHAAK